MIEWLTTTGLGVIVFILGAAVVLYAAAWTAVFSFQYARGTHQQKKVRSYYSSDTPSANFVRQVIAIPVASVLALGIVLIGTNVTVWAPNKAEAQAAFYEENEELIEQTLLTPPEEVKTCKRDLDRDGRTTAMTFRVGENYDKEALAEILNSEHIVDAMGRNYILISVHAEHSQGGYGNINEGWFINSDDTDLSAITADNMLATATRAHC